MYFKIYFNIKKELYITHIYFRKAYDSIQTNSIIMIMKSYRIHGDVINVIVKHTQTR